jgi:hypothetical protein
VKKIKEQFEGKKEYVGKRFLIIATLGKVIFQYEDLLIFCDYFEKYGILPPEFNPYEDSIDSHGKYIETPEDLYDIAVDLDLELPKELDYIKQEEAYIDNFFDLIQTFLFTKNGKLRKKYRKHCCICGKPLNDLQIVIFNKENGTKIKFHNKYGLKPMKEVMK